MQPFRSMLPALLVLGACAESATAPSGNPPPAPTPALKEQGAIIQCVASSTTGGYSVTLSWSRVRVKYASLITEAGTLTAILDHPQRNGTVGFTPASEPVGFRLEDGRKIVAQGGCAAP